MGLVVQSPCIIIWRATVALLSQTPPIFLSIGKDPATANTHLMFPLTHLSSVYMLNVFIIGECLSYREYNELKV